MYIKQEILSQDLMNIPSNFIHIPIYFIFIFHTFVLTWFEPKQFEIISEGQAFRCICWL